jgi:hypothetical protein
MSPEIIKYFQVRLFGTPFCYMNEKRKIIRGWIFEGGKYLDVS